MVDTAIKITGQRNASRLVACSDANAYNKLRADAVLSGADDEVQINAFFAEVGAGCHIEITEGTVVSGAPIAFTDNNQKLSGQGSGTFIDGDALTTGNHAIVIDGVMGCTVKDLRGQTEDGGTKTCHFVFVNDGASDTHIQRIIVDDCDSDAIHIEGTTMNDIHIHSCIINDADGHGIYVGMDADNSCTRMQIIDNVILSVGEEGIQLDAPTGTGSNNYSGIDTNLISEAGSHGINVHSCDHYSLCDNIILDCTSDGVLVTNCNEGTIDGNVVWSCGENGIALEGTSVNDGVFGNVCTDNGADGTYAGINTSTVSYMNIVGNLCYNNRKYGIAFGVGGGGFNNVTGNICRGNYEDGIIGGGADTLIEGNVCWDNSSGAAGTDHGITLTNNCARNSVIGNWCGDDGGNVQEDGIHLEDGATYCLIRGNYCFNMMGSGIHLVANNVDCVVSGNYCNGCDDYGISILDGADGCMVNDNKCHANTSHGIYINANDYCTVNGNICTDNTGAATDGINLNSCDYCTLIGNICQGNGDDGIVLQATSTKCIVLGNQLSGNTGAALTDDGTDTQIGHNITA